jgi:hypothetical protein
MCTDFSAETWHQHDNHCYWDLTRCGWVCPPAAEVAPAEIGAVEISAVEISAVEPGTPDPVRPTPTAAL